MHGIFEHSPPRIIAYWIKSEMRFREEVDLRGMNYRVVFEKRSRSDGEPSAMDPTLLLDQELAEGVVADKSQIEWIESDADHGEDALDEDDAFLGMASADVWEYEVFTGKEAEFENAMRRSRVVLEYTVVDEDEIAADDADPVRLREPLPIPSGVGDATEDEGPAGQKT